MLAGSKSILEKSQPAFINSVVPIKAKAIKYPAIKGNALQNLFCDFFIFIFHACSTEPQIRLSGPPSRTVVDLPQSDEPPEHEPTGGCRESPGAASSAR